MFELPVDESISLNDLREANRQLVSCGASIVEINAVRRAFSAVKGGKLAARAAANRSDHLIVSDTNPGDITALLPVRLFSLRHLSPAPPKLCNVLGLSFVTEIDLEGNGATFSGTRCAIKRITGALRFAR